MDAPEPPSTPPPAPRTPAFLAADIIPARGFGAVAGISLEAVRVFAGGNEHTVIPGRVYRSAQMSRAQLQRSIAEKKIRTVINLRGCCPKMPWYLDEARATHAHRNQPGRHHALGEALSASRRDRPADRGPRPHRLPGPSPLPARGRPHRAGCRHRDPHSRPTRASPRRGGNCGRATGTSRSAAPAGSTSSSTTTRTGSRLTASRTRPSASAAGSRSSIAPGRSARNCSSCPRCRSPHSRVAGFTVEVRATNRSVEPWTFSPGGSGGIRLRYTLYTKAGAFVHRGHAGLLERTVHPGESIDLTAGFPPIAAGKHMLHADLLDAQPIDLLDTDFSQYGSEPLIVELVVK